MITNFFKLFLKIFILSNIFTNTYHTCYSNRIKTIDVKNIILINEEISENTVSKFMRNLYNIEDKSNVLIYLDTPGGSVTEGLTIINEIKKYNLSCIVKKAYSMGFAILQYCNVRYIEKYASVMQHQMSYNIGGERMKIESSVKYIKSISDMLNLEQANRIGLSLHEFEEKTENDWWLFDSNIIKENLQMNLLRFYIQKILLMNYIKKEN